MLPEVMICTGPPLSVSRVPCELTPRLPTLVGALHRGRSPMEPWSARRRHDYQRNDDWIALAREDVAVANSANMPTRGFMVPSRPFGSPRTTFFATTCMSAQIEPGRVRVW